MQIVVNGLITYYEKQGQAKQTLLMLHGWGDTARSFGVLASKLSENYSVLRLDLPGFGQTQAPKEVWGLDEYADFVQSFIKKTDTAKLHAIIGHSNGGALAIKGLASGKLDSHKLVLLSSAGIRDQQNLRRMSVKLVAKIGKVVTIWMPKSWREKLQVKLYGAVGSDMFVAPHIKETFKKTVRQDVQADASKIKIPTLLIYGSNDKATPPAYGTKYNFLILGSRLETIDGAQHFVHHDKPDKVKNLIMDFLK